MATWDGLSRSSVFDRMGQGSAQTCQVLSELKAQWIVEGLGNVQFFDTHLTTE